MAVVDEDEARHETYPVVDLEAKEVLLAGGLDPSELDLRFHQQMVYAVTMRTIKAFEQALGRTIRWPWSSSDKNRLTNRLRLYPHASGDANAHFDPTTGAIRFGYAPPTDANGNPTSVDELVFTSLSFDVIAHETVHALLSAIFPVSPGGMTAEAQALHEGLADIVALLGHFEFRDAVVETIERTGGRIYAPTMAADVEAPTADRLILAERARANPLLEIAPQFGAALGMGGALRTALGSPPDPAALALATEPHDRGIDPGCGRLRRPLQRPFAPHPRPHAHRGRLECDGRSRADPPGSRRAPRRGGDEDRTALHDHLRPGARLLSAGQRGFRRLPARDRHLRHGGRPQRRLGVSRRRSSTASARAG